jgi:hypothetical protein
MKKLLFILLILILLTGCTNIQKENYKNNLLETHNSIQENTKTCLLANNYYSTVWKNAIENRKDFNIELVNAVSESEKLGQYKTMNKSKDNIDNKMKQLSNPPKAYQHAYDKLLEMYGIYTQLYSLALNPSGSLVSYNNTINDLQGKLVKASSEFKVLIPSN